MSRNQRTCPTGKVRYPSPFAAMIELWKVQSLRAQGTWKRQEDRFYRCDQCEGYHLTSQPQRTPDQP